MINSIGANGSGFELPACVVWTNPKTGKHTVSAPIFTYSDASDTGPAYISVGPLLWVYDSDTTKGSELLRISNVTERVQRTIKMPGFDRPVIKADRSGLWFGASNEGGVEGRGQPILYFVGAHAAKPIVVLRNPSAGFVSIGLLCSNGDRIWAQVFTHGVSGPYVGYEIAYPGAKPLTVHKAPFASCAQSEEYQL